jgi:uncharacterized protein involved in cysteine biosynthesis
MLGWLKCRGMWGWLFDSEHGKAWRTWFCKLLQDISVGVSFIGICLSLLAVVLQIAYPKISDWLFWLGFSVIIFGVLCYFIRLLKHG